MRYLKDFFPNFFLTKNRILSCLCCNNFSIFNINQPYKLKTYNLPNELSEVNSISSLAQPKGYELAILGTEKGAINNNINIFEENRYDIIGNNCVGNTDYIASLCSYDTRNE